MRPLREHMGPRLLQSSGSSDEATQQRLLTAVRHSLASPGSDKKRIRKELERWKRKHRADWCDVDALLAAAQKSVDAGTEAAASAAAKAAAGSSSSGDAVSASSEGSKEIQPAAVQGSAVSATPQRASGEGAVPEVRADSVEGVCGADGVDMIHLSPCSTVSPTPCLLSACPSRADLCAVVGATSVPTATTAAAPTLLAEASAAAATARQSAASQASTPEATTSTSSAPTPPTSSTPITTQAASSTSSSSKQTPGTTSTATTTTRKATSKSASTPAEDTWTVEQLLELPVGQLRPVVLADFDAALQIIMCTELDQTRQYEEWNNEYGSGADSKGGKSKHWMGMYS